MVLAVFMLIGVGFVAVLVDLQAVRPDRYRDLGEDQRTRSRSLAGYRGDILDRDGFVLASSTPGQEIIVDPQLINDPDQVAALLGQALGVEPSSLLPELTPSDANDRYGLVAKEVEEAAVTRVLELFASANDGEMSGVILRPIEQRVYPASTLGRPVVGGVDPDEQGTFGLEWQFDELLEGHAGFEEIERGAFGSISGGSWSVEPPTQGHDVVLTIDHRIQYVVEQALIDHCQQTRARSANSVVTDPRTGEILAMATVLKMESGACVVPRWNAPLQDSFEPGSVLKLVTMAGAIEEFGYSGATPIPVPPSIVVEDKEFVDHPPHAAAEFPISQIMADSMNVGTIKLSQQLGATRLHDYLMAFGFGQESGLGFKDENNGRVRDVDDWHGSDEGSIALGQGISVNSVQLLSAYNTIANDGVYVAPLLVRALIGPDGEEKPIAPQQSRQVVSARTANELTSILATVVTQGTGTAAAVPGYTVAGKTGTAWKVFSDGEHEGTYGIPGERSYIVTFAGFLPAENPELSIVVVVDEPITDTSAGRVAAPVFADIAHYVLRILGIPPVQAGIDEAAGPVRGTPAGMTEEELWQFQHPGQDPIIPATPDDEASDAEADDTANPDGTAPTDDGATGTTSEDAASPEADASG